VQQRGVRAVLAEPEAGACRAAAALFGLPVVQAGGAALPIADGAVDAAWSLGVLCTMQDQLGLLTELRRVVRPPGRVGLLVYVATTQIPEDEQPEGNRFPTMEQLEELFRRAGLTLVARKQAAELGDAPQAWQRRVDEVEAEIEQQHGQEEAWEVAQQQSDAMGRLIADSAVTGVLFSLRHR
jgi:SAM-dependent methyltransferase